MSFSVNVNAAAKKPPQTVNRHTAMLFAAGFAFMAALALGFCIGIVALPVVARDMASLLIVFGALLIAGAALLRALWAERREEDLQNKLLDEKSYHSFIDRAIEGFFRTTREGNYLIVNPALARIYGYESPEQLKQELSAACLYIDQARRDEFKALMTNDGKIHDFISQIRRRDGVVIWIAENAHVVTDEDGQFLFYEGTVEDITVQIESAEATKKALAETQEAARSKAAFLAAMSHELKTPLNAVIGFSDLMLQEIFGPVSEPRYRSYIGDIHDNGRRLLAMINDILDLTRIEGGLIEMEEDKIFLPEVVRSAWNGASGGKSDLPAIEFHVPDCLPLILGDAKRVRQIVTHLLSNAAKFTAKDGRVSVKAVRTDEGGIDIAIADTGIGMEPGRIAHALEPFKQLDNRLARRFEGVGLGLPLANALIRLHGGRLTIVSRPGAGTTVTIGFPPERTIEPAYALTA